MSAVAVRKYERSRFWAVWRGAELVAVTVYRKGAESVAREIEKLERYEKEDERNVARLVPAA